MTWNNKQTNRRLKCVLFLDTPTKSQHDRESVGTMNPIDSDSMTGVLVQEKHGNTCWHC